MLFLEALKSAAMNQGVPIRPDELPKLQQQRIPGFVFDAVNGLLSIQASANNITLRLKDVKNAIIDEMKKRKIQGQFENWWLDFEASYRLAGWVVEYDSPAYCESYEAFYKFSKKNL